MKTDGVLYKKKHNSYRGMVISVGVFAVVLGLFLFAVSRTTQSSSDYEIEVLEAAIDESILSCYVTEGRYPESFDYLKSKYGLTYDSTRYRVDYIVYASNMKPDVTIITLGEDK